MTAGFGVDVAAVLPAVLVGLAAALAVAAFVRPAPRLAPRLRPYNSANRVRLGRPADVADPAAASSPLSGGAFAAVLGPIAASAARALGRLVDHEDDAALLLRLRNAGRYADLPASERLQRYRLERLGYVAAAVAAAVALGVLAGSVTLLAAGAFAGAIGGLTLPRARLDAAIRRRRDHMTIDLHAVNHQLAMAQMTGAGIDEALQRIADRGRGPSSASSPTRSAGAAPACRSPRRCACSPPAPPSRTPPAPTRRSPRPPRPARPSTTRCCTSPRTCATAAATPSSGSPSNVAWP